MRHFNLLYGGYPLSRLPARYGLRAEVAEEVLELRGRQPPAGEPPADVAAIAFEVGHAARVREQIDDLRQVDEHEAAVVDQGVVRGEVAVGVSGARKDAHRVDALIEQARQLARRRA